MRHRILFPLLLVLSATAFSASAMAASDSKPHQIIQNTPPVDGPHHHPYLFAQNGVMTGHQIF
ncbi:hypothetical protein AXM70_23645 [Salmonella enterica subsp. enterica]|nr:hypothetical protein [Salmonella enterica subsp. enterica]MIQ61178.1 hypothetical protein [Salmonella enterica subsp. enterica]